MIAGALNAGILRERVILHNAIFKPHKRPATVVHRDEKHRPFRGI